MNKNRPKFLSAAFCAMAVTVLFFSVAAVDCCKNVRHLISARFDELEAKRLSVARTDSFFEEYFSTAGTLFPLRASVRDAANPHKPYRSGIIQEMLLRHIFFDVKEDLANLKREVHHRICGVKEDEDGVFTGPSLPVTEPSSTPMAKNLSIALLDLRFLLYDPNLVVFVAPAMFVYPSLIPQYFWKFLEARRRNSL